MLLSNKVISSRLDESLTDKLRDMLSTQFKKKKHKAQTAKAAHPLSLDNIFFKDKTKIKNMTA